jgi:diguanylate cyclase (GGDEF)-like protein
MKSTPVSTPLAPEELAAVREQLSRRRVRYRLPAFLKSRLALQRQKEFIQVTFLLGPVVYLLFALIAGVALYQFPEDAMVGWNAQVFWGFLGFNTVGITLGYFLTFAPVVRRHYLWLIVINGSLQIASPLAASLLLTDALMRQEMSYVVMLVVGVVVGVLRAPVAVSAATCGLALVQALALVLALDVTPAWTVLCIFYFGAVGTALLMAYLMERLELIGFLRGVVLAHESAEIVRLNAELARLATEDGLTGLANRRHFEDRLHVEWERAQRQVDHLALLFIEVDFFRAYLDRYGHTAGDECLVAVAQALSGSLQRPVELAARYGTEEFVVLLPDTDLVAARAAAARASAAVAALRRPHAGSPSGEVSISIGIAAQRALTGSPREFVDHADKALYSARTAGRGSIREAAL